MTRIYINLCFFIFAVMVIYQGITKIKGIRRLNMTRGALGGVH